MAMVNLISILNYSKTVIDTDLIFVIFFPNIKQRRLENFLTSKPNKGHPQERKNLFLYCFGKTRCNINSMCTELGILFLFSDF